MGDIQKAEYDLPPTVVRLDRFRSEHRRKTASEPRSAVAARGAMSSLGGAGKNLPGNGRYIGFKLGEREDALGYRAPQAALHKFDPRRRRRSGDRRDSGSGIER